MENPTQAWTKIGELDGLNILQSKDNELAIERDFELLCALTEEELTLWNKQQRKTSDAEQHTPA